MALLFTHSIPEHDVHTKLPTVTSVYVTPGWLHSKQCLFTPDWASSRTLREQISWLSRCLRFDIFFFFFLTASACQSVRAYMKPPLAAVLPSPPPGFLLLLSPFTTSSTSSRPHSGDTFLRLHLRRETTHWRSSRGASRRAGWQPEKHH